MFYRLIEKYGKKKLIVSAIALALIVAAAIVIPVVLLNGNKEDPTQPTADNQSAHVHVLLMTEEKAPTCMAEGNHTYYTCTECEKVYADKKAVTETTVAAQTVAKISHDFSAWGHNSNQHWEICSMCDAPKSEERADHILNEEYDCACGSQFSLKTGAINNDCTWEALLNVNEDVVWRTEYFEDGSVSVRYEALFDDDENLMKTVMNNYDTDGALYFTLIQTYFENGNTQKSTDIYYESDGTKNIYEYEYDEDEKILKSTALYYDENGELTFESVSLYDENEDCTEITDTYYTGAGEIDHIYKEEYEWDEDHLCQKKWVYEDGILDYSQSYFYNEEGELIKSEQYNAEETVTTTIFYEYYEDGRSKKETAFYGNSNVLKYEYEWYPSGEWKKQIDCHENGEIYNWLEYDEDGNVINKPES